MERAAPSLPLRDIPADIVSAEDYERYAQAMLPPPIFAHIAGGAGREQTLRANQEAFERVFIYPRALADCTWGDTVVNVLGKEFSHPIFLAPISQHGLVHLDAELASAQGAAAMEACFAVSTLSTRPLEEIARATSAEKWFQLYAQPSRDATIDLARRAEAAGYAAILVTVDAPVHPQSRRAARAGFAPPPSVPANLAGYSPPPPKNLSTSASMIFQGLMQDAPTWAELEEIIAAVRIPVLLKGVAHPDDAARAIDAGAAGIVVSNHGGRTLDGAPATLDALPAIRARLGRDACVLLDGGVRSGADIFKAMALGANAVMIGRPFLYALAAAGALGVAHLLKLLRAELEVVMALAGCPRLSDASGAHLFR